MQTIDRNADKCEAAREKRCVCACGGALHGVAHSRAWREKVFQDAQAAQAARLHALRKEIKTAYPSPGKRELLRYCHRCRKYISRRHWGARCPAIE